MTGNAQRFFQGRGSQREQDRCYLGQQTNLGKILDAVANR